MTVPDDTVTPPADEAPDPVAASEPQAPPAPEDVPEDETLADEKGQLPGITPVRPVGESAL